MVIAKRWIKANNFVGELKPTDFKLVEEDLGPLKDGQVLCEAEWLSVDPYHRAYAERIPNGSTMIGGQIAK